MSTNTTALAPRISQSPLLCLCFPGMLQLAYPINSFPFWLGVAMFLSWVNKRNFTNPLPADTTTTTTLAPGLRISNPWHKQGNSMLEGKETWQSVLGFSLFAKTEAVRISRKQTDADLVRRKPAVGWEAGHRFYWLRLYYGLSGKHRLSTK